MVQIELNFPFWRRKASTYEGKNLSASTIYEASVLFYSSDINLLLTTFKKDCSESNILTHSYNNSWAATYVIGSWSW